MGDKFKVGDKVVIVGGYSGHPDDPDDKGWIGVPGTVVLVDMDFAWPYFVKHERDNIPSPCDEYEIRLVEDKQ